MRLITAFLVSLFALPAWAQSPAAVDPASTYPRQHWATIRTPHEDKFFDYQSAPEAMGYGVTIGSYAHLKNKQVADRLLEQIVKLLQPLPKK